MFLVKSMRHLVSGKMNCLRISGLSVYHFTDFEVKGEVGLEAYWAAGTL